MCVHGRFCAIEAKVDGRATEEQLVELDKINAAGGIGRIVLSLQEVKQLLDKIQC